MGIVAPRTLGATRVTLARGPTALPLRRVQVCWLRLGQTSPGPSGSYAEQHQETGSRITPGIETHAGISWFGSLALPLSMAKLSSPVAFGWDPSPNGFCRPSGWPAAIAEAVSIAGTTQRTRLERVRD